MQKNDKFEQIRFNYECEILSALFSNIEDRSLILASLNLSNFADQSNRIIFKIIKQLVDEDNDFNFSDVEARIEIDNDYCTIDDVKKRLDYIYVIGRIVNIENKIQTLVNISSKSKLDELSKKIIDTNLDLDNAQTQIYEWKNTFENILTNQSINEVPHISSAIDEYRIKLDNISNNSDCELTGITSGYESIDAYTNGFQKGDLIILAARPSVGKTALSLNFALNAARTLLDKKDDIIVIFSLEMSKEQILQRMIANVGSIKNQDLRSNNISEQTKKIIFNTIEYLSKFPIYIEDNSNLTIFDIDSKLRQLAKKKNIKLVIIDYLQLIYLPISKSYGKMNRVIEVGLISKQLKNIARSLNVPIIALSQLSREIEKRKQEERKPMLSDLRESGNIEQDADLVTFIDVDYSILENKNDNQYGNIKNKQAYNSYRPNMIFYIEKHRNGMIGSVKLIFDKSTGQFIALDSNERTRGFN